MLPHHSKPLQPAQVRDFVQSIFREDLHAKRIQSLAGATIGVLHAAAIGIHAIGRGLAAAQGKDPKHTVKQVDRLFSNPAIVPWELFEVWVPFVLADLSKVFVNLDWTDFDDDGQCSLVASVQTVHGRSTPLMWLTVEKATLAGSRNDYEDRLLLRLAEVVPKNVKVTVVADRGFADSKLYGFLEELSFDYIIRFRQDVLVTSTDGETRKAGQWVTGARTRVFRDALVTGDKCPVPTVVVMHKANMKDVWCLVASDPTATGKDLAKRYGRRFTIEEMFRDVKDPRFGLGLRWSRIGEPARRDRLLLVVAFAQYLLEMLGKVGEDLKFDRFLKTNTSKKRTLSLLRQGLMWYDQLPMMKEERAVALMTAFEAEILRHPVFGTIWGAK